MFTELVNILAKFGKTNFASKANFVLFFAVVLILIAVLVYFAIQWNSSRVIDEINFSGNKIIDTKELNAMISKDIINKSKDSVELSKIESKINKHALVLSSSVSFDGISGIDVEIIEREPKAYVLSGKGNVYLTDTSGYLLPIAKLKQQAMLPLVRLKDSELKAAANPKNAVAVLNELSNVDFKYLYSMLEHITMDKRGYILKFCDMDFDVVIGKAEKLRKKMEKLSSFWKEILIKKSIIDIDYIDLRWEDRIITK